MRRAFPNRADVYAWGSVDRLRNSAIRISRSRLHRRTKLASRLRSRRELWNLVTLRLEIEVAVQDRLDTMETLAQEVIVLLEAEFGRGTF